MKYSSSKTLARILSALLIAATVVAGLVVPSFDSDAPSSLEAFSTRQSTFAAVGENPGEANSQRTAAGASSDIAPVAYTGKSAHRPQYSHKDLVFRSNTGRLRNAIVAMPVGVARKHKLPVLVAFHANTQSAASFEHGASLEASAARLNAIIVYPQGVGRAWEGPTYARTRRGEDVQFVKQVLQRVSRDHAVDWNRIYTTGFSNGGAMALNMACQAPDLVAGAVGVTGAYYKPEFSRCKSGRVATMMIHQAGDQHMKIDGGSRNGMEYYSQAGMLRELGKRAGCRPSQLRQSHPARGVTVYQYSGCRTETKAIRVAGGWHRWETELIDVPAFVWSFLARQHK
ncbi:PHB depolymerase family esterase [uncultured Corynebacterium sp.]|uniref:alpha/beta hydrolase family esterase n=1 Tax=uncultured Corynebacterium sp. TaxID=159447 RepID=UPI0025ECBCDF|nr:PHB depolymerase family esterase [uncultured Corynebacterium sp.]